MDAKGNIYEGTKERPLSKEDHARLDGYLKGRAEGDAEKQRQLDELAEAIEQRHVDLEEEAEESLEASEAAD